MDADAYLRDGTPLYFKLNTNFDDMPLQLKLYQLLTNDSDPDETDKAIIKRFRDRIVKGE